MVQHDARYNPCGDGEHHVVRTHLHPLITPARRAQLVQAVIGNHILPITQCPWNVATPAEIRAANAVVAMAIIQAFMALIETIFGPGVRALVRLRPFWI